MPLHLLSKKSWNVYSPAAIARVRQDEAAAEAREAEHERKLQEHDAARRVALLRGESPPPTPSPPQSPSRHRTPQGEREAKRGHLKRKRLAGEDDTDRDIRLARQDASTRHGSGGGGEHHHHHRQQQQQPLTLSKRDADAPLADHKGHIQIFAPPPPPSTRELRAGKQAEKNAEAEAERRAKEKEYEDQYTLRFSNAAGFKQDVGQTPWYASGPGTGARAGTSTDTTTGRDFHVKDANDQKDPRKARASGDPMASMQRAQTQLKHAQREREKSRREMEQELQRLRREQDVLGLRIDRYDDDEEEAGLAGFSLDASASAFTLADEQHHRRRRHDGDHRRESKHRRHHRDGDKKRNRSRSRSRSPDRHHRHGHANHHHQRRSRSTSRDRRHTHTHTHKHERERRREHRHERGHRHRLEHE